eukprot:TRINITY_DN46676_c0_g2_i2.p2 TRINITY_DN46676_c0_g2~~TRINITY_DN46676_c0_g2_i2.p2  ORF type:complete len:132 (+),score=11.04 TRINITY_DN46676_c0_g2_i2:1586-1981(+)
MKSLARSNELNKNCISRLDDASVPKLGSPSTGRVQILLSTESHSKGSDHLHNNHRIKFKGSNKLRHKDRKIHNKIRDDKQSRIMLTNMVEHIAEILYAILGNKEVIMQMNVYIGICIAKENPLMMNSMMSR